jgi:hypothetical protein
MSLTDATVPSDKRFGLSRGDDKNPRTQPAGTSSLILPVLSLFLGFRTEPFLGFRTEPFLGFRTEPFLGFRTEPFALRCFLLLKFEFFPTPADQLTGAGMPTLERVVSAVHVILGNDHRFIADQGAFAKINALERIDRWSFIDVLASGDN